MESICGIKRAFLPAKNCGISANLIRLRNRQYYILKITPLLGYSFAPNITSGIKILFCLCVCVWVCMCVCVSLSHVREENGTLRDSKRILLCSVFIFETREQKYIYTLIWAYMKEHSN